MTYNHPFALVRALTISGISGNVRLSETLILPHLKDLTLHDMLLAGHNESDYIMVQRWRWRPPSNLRRLTMHMLSIVKCCYGKCNSNSLSCIFRLCPQLWSLSISTVNPDFARYLIFTQNY